MLVRELAAMLDALWEGDGDREVKKVASIEAAVPSDVSFVAAGRAAKTVPAASEAGCLIVPLNYSNTREHTIIRVPDPRGAIAKVVAKLHPKRQPARRIHPTAVIGAGAVPNVELARLRLRLRLGHHALPAL